MLKNKNILLGVTGSIAAYKAAILIRLLIKENAKVKVVMTDYAKEFITPLTLSTLSKFPVYSNFFSREQGTWNNHVSLADWADLFLIAPATANTIGKMSNGIADNLLLTTYLSAKCQVMIAPAMDLVMYQHKTNQNNLKILKSYGNIIIEPETGELASGLEGKGRMKEPEKILEIIKKYFNHKGSSLKKKLKNKKCLVTAGPTYEMIDPVRFIGNFSSGKMGYSIATELSNQGADVVLISGPVNIKIDHPNINVVEVKSAKEMYDACIQLFTPDIDMAILTAAVSDFTPSLKRKKKIKKGNKSLNIELIPTRDIAAEISKRKEIKQKVIGFALETDNEIENAYKKLKKKNFDFIVLNSLNDVGAGFNYDTNKITIIDKNKNIEEYDLKTKAEAAHDIVKKLLEII